MIIKPRAHQSEFMDFHKRPNAMMGSLAWHSMGLGKTLSALWLARDHLAALRKKGINAKFMIVMPKSAINTWKVECSNNTPDLMPHMIIYPYSQLHHAIKRIKYVDIRFLIFDEVHYLKSPETERVKTLAEFFKALSMGPGKFEGGRIFMGTGTPMPNHAAELFTSWAICCAPNLYEAAERLLSNDRFENWKKLFTNKKDVNWTVGKKRPPSEQRRGYAVKYEGVANEGMLQQLLSPFVHFKRVEDCIDLPKHQEIAIDLGLQDDVLLQNANIEEPEAYMALVERLSRAKTPHMIEWVREFIQINNEQLLIFALNRHPIEELQKQFPNHVKLLTGSEKDADRAKNIKDFQEGRIRILASTYKCGSESHNFQNCAVSLYHGYPWHDGALKQAIRRTVRSGQKRNTLHYFLTSGQNDRRILGNVRRKEEATTIVENILLSNNEKVSDKELTVDDLI